MRTGIAVIAAVACVLTGCGAPGQTAERTVTVTSTLQPAVATTPPQESDRCVNTSAPLTTLTPKAGSEPRMAIPQPAGWERFTQMDSDMVRAMIGNPSLRANEFTPSANVTLEKVTGKVQTAQQALDAEEGGIVKLTGSSVDGETAGTVCGIPSKTVNYTLPAQGAVPARKATVLIVAASYDREIYAACLTIQTIEPNNPTYLADSRAILDGFQFMPPEQHR